MVVISHEDKGKDFDKILCLVSGDVLENMVLKLWIIDEPEPGLHRSRGAKRPVIRALDTKGLGLSFLFHGFSWQLSQPREIGAVDAKFLNIASNVGTSQSSHRL